MLLSVAIKTEQRDWMFFLNLQHMVSMGLPPLGHNTPQSFGNFWSQFCTCTQLHYDCTKQRKLLGFWNQASLTRHYGFVHMIIKIIPDCQERVIACPQTCTLSLSSSSVCEGEWYLAASILNQPQFPFTSQLRKLWLIHKSNSETDVGRMNKDFGLYSLVGKRYI